MRLNWLLACLVGLVASIAADATFAATKKIMIVTAPGLGCDATCVGFKDGIAKSGIDAEIIVRDASKKEALPGFVAEARELHVDLVNTIGTSATLGMVGTLSDVGSGKYLEDIPVVFTIVADPLGAKIIKSYESTGRDNVTGTYNRVPEAVHLKAMRAIVPNLKKLGLLYDRHERNSMLKLADMQEQAPKLGFELVALELGPDESATPDPANIPGLVAELAAKGVDFIYVGSSAFLLSPPMPTCSLRPRSSIACPSSPRMRAWSASRTRSFQSPRARRMSVGSASSRPWRSSSTARNRATSRSRSSRTSPMW
jgi:putative ABC transport system substrate-binding protein